MPASKKKARAARREPKSARLDLRLQPALKSMLEEAAALTGASVSDFCVSAVRRAAEEQLRASQTIRLRGRDAEVFFEALVRPPAPNAALRRAAREHAKRVVAD